jgi:antigen flippase
LSNHKSIFKTSLITGGSQILVMFFNIIRAKFLAVYLGPTGTGLIGLFTTTTDLVASISGMGINSSAVKEIALANKSEDKSALQKILFVFRLIVIITGIIGTMFLFLFSDYFSLKVFKDTNHSMSFQWLSIIVLFSSLTAGQYGLMQGLRKIRELAIAKIVGTIIGTLVCTSLVYFYKESAIVSFIIIGSIATFLLSWFFANKLGIVTEKPNKIEFKQISSKLIKLGFAFLISSLTVTATTYFSRLFISHIFSIQELGIYTACWTLSAIYVNFILSAMGADFYPRLTEIINDHKSSIQLINQQTEIGLLMAIIGIVGVVTFSSLALDVFYSKEFLVGFKILQWMTLGMALKIVTWPLGFVVVTKGKMKLFMALEISWGVIYLILLKVLTKEIGFEGIGIAFFITYLINGIFVLISAINLINFKWSKSVLKMLIITSILLVAAVISTRTLSPKWQNITSSIIVLFTIGWVYYIFQRVFEINIFQFLRRKFQ